MKLLTEDPERPSSSVDVFGYKDSFYVDFGDEDDKKQDGKSESCL